MGNGIAEKLFFMNCIFFSKIGSLLFVFSSFAGSEESPGSSAGQPYNPGIINRIMIMNLMTTSLIERET